MAATSKPADAYAGSAMKARGAGQYLPHRRLFLQRSLLLVKAALTLHRYLAVTPFAQGGGSTRSCAIGIQSRIPSGWHFETASPFGIGRSLRRLIWAQHNAQTLVAAISLLRNRRGGYHYRPEVWSHCCRAFDTAPPVPSSGNVNTALDRIEIPQDVVERVSELLSPGSSLTISDYGLSRETGNDTDFIVVMP